jgi:hypothetical protein
VVDVTQAHGRKTFEDQMIKVTVTVDFGPVDQRRVEKTVRVPERSTVFEALMISVRVRTSPKYGMEYFVEEIQEISNDFERDRGWHFEVNGYRSNVPAERYLVKDGDWIKWLYLGDARCC